MKRYSMVQYKLLVTNFIVFCFLIAGCSNPKPSQPDATDDTSNKVIQEVELPNNENEQDASINEETTSQENYDSEIREYIDDAIRLAEEGKYLDAKATLVTATDLYGKSELINTANLDIDRIQFLSEVEKALSVADYTEAMKIVRACNPKLISEEEIILKSNVVKQYFVRDVLDKADYTLHNEGIDAALAVVNDGIALFSNDDQLMDMRQKLKDLKPLLFDYENIKQKSSNFKEIYTTSDKRSTDIFSNTLENVFGVCWYKEKHDECTLTYTMSEEYDRITGSIFVPFKKRKTEENSEMKFKVEFWGDGKIIGENYATNNEGPVSFDIDIRGVKILEIKFYSEFLHLNGLNPYYEAWLANVNLEKNY